MDNQQNDQNVVEQAVQQPVEQVAQQPVVQPAPAVSEEQLRRTYKGIEFRTEEEKNQIVALEAEAEKYCENLESRSYKELCEKNQQWSNLPNAIFMPYIIKVMSEMGPREAAELEGYKTRIATASLEEVESIKAEIEQQAYSAQAVAGAMAVINERRKACQVSIFEEMLVGFASFSRNDLKALKERVIAKNFEADVTNVYIDKINYQYDVVEQNELQNMCSNVDNMGMKELDGVLRILTTGGYQDKFAAQYVKLVNDRIEVLQYQELEALTADKDNMNKEQLQALYQQLEQGSFNPKFVKKFLVDVRMCIDNRSYNEVSAMTSNVATDSKEAVLATEKALNETGYTDGMLFVARKKIADRKFELEMNELIDMCNDFDALSNEEADKLIASVNEKGFSKKSADIYLDKLSKRKFDIAHADVTRLAAYFVGLANRYQFPGNDILISSKTDAFLNAVAGLKTALPQSGAYDVPAFIMSGSVNIAFSYKYCYLNANNKPLLIDVININGLKVVKKLFVESLVMELKDGSTVPVTGNINKQLLPTFVQMMNEFIPNINNRLVIDTFPQPTYNVEPLNKADYACASKEYVLLPDEMMVNTLGVICVGEATREMAKAIHFAANKDWDQYQQKTKTNYQIPQDEKLVFVYDKSLLNNAKDGFALSKDNVYVKKANQPLTTLNMKDIFAVKCDEASKVYIETTGLTPVYLEIAATPACAAFVASELDEYVKDMQLCMAIS